jgi:hypothetical protein
VREHHEPGGMIALCRDHHPEADAGAFSNDDLRELKRTGREKARLLGARFNWMREQLLVRVGSAFYYETPIAIRIGERPIVWFNRSEANRVLVNLSMPSASGDPRLEMRDNFWLTEGTNLRVLNCPPSGKVVQARYANDDLLRIEFRNIDSLEEPSTSRVALRAGCCFEPLGCLPAANSRPVEQAVGCLGRDYWIRTRWRSPLVAHSGGRQGRPVTPSVQGPQIPNTQASCGGLQRRVVPRDFLNRELAVE